MTGLGFDRSLRLLAAAHFQRVFDGADFKVSNRHLLFLARRNGLDHPRLGLVIAKKNVRLAVQRNRIKRLIRETFRHRQHNLDALDVVVLVRRGVDQRDNSQLHQELAELWQRLARRAGADTGSG